MKIIILVILAVVTCGGIYASFPDILRSYDLLGESESESPGGAIGVQTPPEQEVDRPAVVEVVPSAMGALTIVDSEMYYHAPSFVTVRNTGTDNVMLQRVSYGQTDTHISDIHLSAGEQRQLTIPSASGATGSKYVLQVQGVSVASGKLVNAQATAILKEPISRMDIPLSQIDTSNADSPLLVLEILNSGMDSISIVSMECGAPIPRNLWATDGVAVYLHPSDSKRFNFVFDSKECTSIKRVVVRGESSLGNPVLGSAELQIISSAIEDNQSIQSPTELVGTKLPMGQAVINIQEGGHYVLSFEVVNTHYQDVQIDSLKVNGVEIPGWNGMTLLAQTSTKSTITTSYGINSSDIGTSVDIIILGHIFGSSQQGNDGSFYATTSALVYGP